MAEIPKKIEKIVREYLKDLKQIIPVDKAVLFGSYAQGTYGKIVILIWRYSRITS